ncbi:MAG: hypothetical protein IPK26_24340 [Planctomycetes bacterium]|nr:hypothetical protein [Planctomycetota bacterium]
MNRPTCRALAAQRGIALIAVLIALTVLLLLALPFAVSMSVGADIAVQEVEVRQVEQASASVRDLLLADAALSHQAFDATPEHDDVTEFPNGPVLPEKFQALQQGGRVLLGGEVQDLQALAHLDAVTPLLLGNLLGTTARLGEDLAVDGDAVVLDGGDTLPDQGFVWVDHEVIRYGRRDGGKLLELTRGVLQEFGFLRPQDHETVLAGALVLDWRCIAAVSWPFTGRADTNRQQRRPFGSVGELAEIGAAEMGNFTTGELDTLARLLTVDTKAATAPTWGRPERVFYGVSPPGRTLRVKSAVHVGAGSIVRIRDLTSGAYEYNLVMTTSTPRGPRELVLPSEFFLDLLYPVAQGYPAIDTVVEPLVPAPVNVNTADIELLAALAMQIRRAWDVRVHEADGQRRQQPPAPIGRSMARELAEQIAALRIADGAPGQGAFTGWQDFAERVFKPRFDAADNDTARERLLYLYRNLLSGRDSALDMGTLPIAFTSGPWVRYRAAASSARSAVATGVAARHERTGTAVALPGWPLELFWNTQERFEECFRLDQRAQYWSTTPINTGAVPPNSLGNDPTSRYFPHVVGMAFPQANLGQPRFPTKDQADSGIRLAPSVSIPGGWGISGEIRGHETFATALDPRGHDATRSPYTITNTGPSERGGQPPAAPRTHDLTFPFSVDGGGSARWGLSAWFEPEALRTGTLLDHSDGDKERNRIALRVDGDRLLFEVIDEAGLDPNPSASPAGVERTAGEWALPLAELGLPSRTPVHATVAAYGNRPSDLSVSIDGVIRGKGRYTTTLTAPIGFWDPQLDPRAYPPGSSSRDKSLILVQVESTEGFPPVGVLKIGLELFEYTAISGNSFACVYNDSLGGRGARMEGFEFRPDIPVDENGRATVDVDRLRSQGINLDVYPEHPVGSTVSLYGYSTHPTHDTPMYPGGTALPGSIGAFTVARGVIRNPRPITITPPRGSPIQIGTGIDLNWNDELELADPVPTERFPPPAASDEVAAGFSTSGGFALLVQTGFRFTPSIGTTTTGTSALVGGIEVIRYGARQGNKLTGIQRAARLPGRDDQIRRDWYDGASKQFICDWEEFMVVPRTQPPVRYDQVPTYILWVVPISLAVQDASRLPNPAALAGLTEWAQIYPQNNETDTEWVRYDHIEGNYLVRALRAAWDSVRNELTRQVSVEDIQVGTGGPINGTPVTAEAVWGTVQATSGYIGYVPQIESTFPQIQAARQRLTFRGDPFTRTSSHAHANAMVLPCHRVALAWNNYGSMYGRPGRQDRIALVAGSKATGTTRPPVEWHTVNWVVRRYNADNLAERTPAELIGPWPFQLMGLKDRVAIEMFGPPADNQTTDIRQLDRIVKFPSGELPAAYCREVQVGGAVGGGEAMAGFVDEVDVVQQVAPDLILDEAFTDSARTFRVHLGAIRYPHGPVFYAGDMTANFPPGGGLVAIDGEILAYQSRQDGTFSIATKGRGLLNTKAIGHDRGAHVHFLTHRPAAILSSSVQPRGDRLPIQTLGAMPGRGGTGLLGGTELLHWTWSRVVGDAATLEMPRFHPPHEDGDGTGPRGLLRGRFGTAPVAASSGEPIIAFPFRHWDRHVPRSDDPELSYFQCTTGEAPVLFTGLTWAEETTDSSVDVECLVRVDGKAPWTADPAATQGLWLFNRTAGDNEPSRIGWMGSQLEARFGVVYKAGCLDLSAFTRHGWKTTPRIERVRLEYQGETRVLAERVSTR